MRQPIKLLLGLAATLFLVAFTVVVINQTLQLVEFAERVSPTLGLVVFWGLCLIYVACLITPIWIYLSLPGPLHPPPAIDDPGFDSHLQQLRKRLARQSPADWCRHWRPKRTSKRH